MAHIPVMLDECIGFFEEKKISTFFDGTVGAGGFAKALLTKHPEIETYFACDQDEYALKIAEETLHDWKDKIVFIHGNFRDLDEQLLSRGVKSVDGFFLTLGCRQCN